MPKTPLTCSQGTCCVPPRCYSSWGCSVPNSVTDVPHLRLRCDAAGLIKSLWPMLVGQRVMLVILHDYRTTMPLHGIYTPNSFWKLIEETKKP